MQILDVDAVVRGGHGAQHHPVCAAVGPLPPKAPLAKILVPPRAVSIFGSVLEVLTGQVGARQHRAGHARGRVVHVDDRHLLVRQRAAQAWGVKAEAQGTVVATGFGLPLGDHPVGLVGSVLHHVGGLVPELLVPRGGGEGTRAVVRVKELGPRLQVTRRGLALTKLPVPRHHPRRGDRVVVRGLRVGRPAAHVIHNHVVVAGELRHGSGHGHLPLHPFQARADLPHPA
mmetsp:Transcript_1107/g.4482  ORF Transcript_1107/g.4482 Transcript_1107/m.4482 type:complete len:229 (+) Transcript_1107:60-746(+)